VIGLLAPPVLALALALGLGGSLHAWSGLRARWWPAFVLAFAVLLVLYSPPTNQQPWAVVAGPWIGLAMKIVIMAVLVDNARHAGASRTAWALAAAGVGLNTLAIAANGGYMPQSTSAAVAVWGQSRATTQVRPDRLENISVLDAETRVPWLSDVIPQPTWLPRPNVVSIGDVLVSLGLAGWVFIVTRGTGRIVENCQSATPDTPLRTRRRAHGAATPGGGRGCPPPDADGTGRHGQDAAGGGRAPSYSRGIG
jgi:hypothetical protein